MNIKLIVVGKTVKSYFNEAEQEYLKRLKRYLKVNYIIIPELKNAKSMSSKQIKEKEGILIEKQLNPTDQVMIMDEKGKQKTSVEFADFLQQKMNQGIKDLVFVIGGAYYGLYSRNKLVASTAEEEFEMLSVAEKELEATN